MEHEIKRKLVRLSNKQCIEDIKKYIKSSYEFYNSKVPEIKILAKRLHEEYSLNEFYRVFNRLWKSGYHEERYLAIETLLLFRDDFDLNTWKFINPKLKEIKSWDKIDVIGSEIIGQIILRYPKLQKKIFRLGKSRNIWLKRMALVSAIPLIKNKDMKLAFKLIKHHTYEKQEPIQKAIGLLLVEIGNQNPRFLKKFLIKNKNLPENTFIYATENMKDLRKLRNMNNPKFNGFQKIFFWKNGLN